jgi:protein ImuB
MRRVASLWLPMLAIERIVRASSASAPLDKPLVTSIADGQRLVIATACARARALGIMPGQPLAQAQAMITGLDIRPADPLGDEALVRRIADHAARRWTPLAAADPPDGLWLDITGAAHLAGGEARLVATMRRRLARAGLSTRIAIAGCYGAAHALARWSKDDVTIIASGSEAQAVSSLPVAALRIDGESQAMLKLLGIERIGELLAMPRAPLARRFGMALVTRLDQATGRAAEPIAAHRPRELAIARCRFAEPIATAEAIGLVIAGLCPDLVARLAEAELGARRLRLAIERVDGSTQWIALGLARAMREVAHFQRLLNPKIEMIDPGFGIDAMSLGAIATEPLSAKQIGSDDNPDLAPLVDRLAGRLGPAALWRAAPVESDVPERAVRRTAPLAEPGGGDPWPAHWPRPVRLLDPPEPASAVIALLPDGAPARFTWRRRTHRVICADGPERIHGEWWKRSAEQSAVRDYFRVEDDAGARFWLYRRGDGVDEATGNLAWFVHGVFA